MNVAIRGRFCYNFCYYERERRVENSQNVDLYSTLQSIQTATIHTHKSMNYAFVIIMYSEFRPFFCHYPSIRLSTKRALRQKNKIIFLSSTDLRYNDDVYRAIILCYECAPIKTFHDYLLLPHHRHAKSIYTDTKTESVPIISHNSIQFWNPVEHSRNNIKIALSKIRKLNFLFTLFLSLSISIYAAPAAYGCV